MKKDNDCSGVEEEEEHEAEKRDENDDKEEEEKEDNEEDDEDVRRTINKEVPTTAPLPMSANGGTPHANREFREQPREEPYAFESPVNARAKAELFLCPATVVEVHRKSRLHGSSSRKREYRCTHNQGKSLTLFF